MKQPKKTDQDPYQKNGVVAEMLEQARQYYLTALEKQNANISGRSSTKL